MENFNYEVIKETEKAVFAKVPYWDATTDKHRKHKQLFYECWIPKAVIEKGVAKDFVIGKRNEIRVKNSYQRICHTMPLSWKTMGEYAPVKVKVVVEEVDEKKLQLLRAELMGKYGVKDYDHGFFISPSDDVTDEVEKIAKAYRDPHKHINNPVVPKINVTYWREELEKAIA